MLFSRHRIVVEQPGSLAQELEAHGIKHGDVAQDVEFVGVGCTNEPGLIRSSLALAFCPASIAKIKKVLPAAPLERAKPLPDTAAWTQDATKVLSEVSFPRRGFARILCDVSSNGSIHLSNVRVIGIEEAHPATVVNHVGMYQHFRATQAAEA